MWRDVALVNPFFYMIDGFRYGFIGHNDGPLVTGAIVVIAIDAGLWWACHRMFACDYKLKD